MCAGQGVVAFAQGAHDDLGYALKFFVHRGPFLAEREMYRCQALQRLLPRVYCEYDPEEKPSGLVDSHARPLPPCLAMERGEGLSDWSRRAKPDIFQAVAVSRSRSQRSTESAAALPPLPPSGACLCTCC